MKLYLNHESSLGLIRYLRSVNGEEGLDGRVSRKRSMDDAIKTVRELEELDTAAQFLLEHVDRPIRAFIPRQAMKTHTKRLVTHVYTSEIRYGSFLDIGHGICICTPQHVFLRLGAERDFVDLVRTGMVPLSRLTARGRARGGRCAHATAHAGPGHGPGRVRRIRKRPAENARHPETSRGSTMAATP